MRFNVNTVVYFYIFICAALLVFNLFYIFRSNGRGRKRELRTRRWAALLEEELAALAEGSQLRPAHQRLMERELKNINKLIAYQEAIEPRLGEALIQVYLDQNHDIYQSLAAAYRRRPAMERAFYAYLMSLYHPGRGRDHDQLVELLLDFLDNSTVYCRENVLRALCAMGSAPALEHALARFHEQGWYHQPRLISDGLTAFAGDRAALARRLWDAGAAWDENLRIGIIQFASNLSESFADLFLPALTQKETSSETRFALIRYFQRKPTPAARPILFELALTGKDEGGPAIAACAALARYPGPDTEQVLEDALLSRNWYVRRNAAASLSALGVEAENLTKPRQSGDRYAVEMLTYMAGIRKSREKVNG